ncbi:MAG: hypothetical protein A2V66_06725 [Ignavibacteria bacterium RBG_13_36_8]|nr:MAG: hypothetical protein A2V66_06725 [Ignavibacteria bacterium RBG_13_36_8]
MVKIKAKHGAINKVCGKLLKLVEPTYKEKGCVNYVLHQDLEDPLIIMLYENCESGDDLEVHRLTKIS